MACNIKFIVLIIKASFFLAMGILEIVTARNTIVEKWSADQDIGFAMSVLNAAQNVCKLIINLAALKHLFDTFSQNDEVPEDDIDSAREDIGLLTSQVENGHIAVNVGVDVVPTVTEHGVLGTTSEPEERGERAVEDFLLATLTETRASAETFTTLKVTTAPAPVCATASAPACSVAPVRALAGVWTWRSAPGASSDEEM